MNKHKTSPSKPFASILQKKQENAAISVKKRVENDSTAVPCLICRGYGVVRDRHSFKDIPCPKCHGGINNQIN